MNNVNHKWQPSVRLRKLMERTGGIKPMPSSGMLATTWLRQHEALFLSKQHCSRLVNIVRYWLSSEMTIDQLRAMVNKSWIRDGRVQGELMTVRNLGVVLFNELKRVLND